ncbi:MAG TPA: DUF1918 domain-containing protein [Cellulomonas sp.]
MRASAGDRLVVHGRTIDTKDRSGEIVETRGLEGGPPFLVRFADGHEGLVFPGPDVQVLPGQNAEA